MVRIYVLLMVGNPDIYLAPASGWYPVGHSGIDGGLLIQMGIGGSGDAEFRPDKRPMDLHGRTSPRR